MFSTIIISEYTESPKAGSPQKDDKLAPHEPEGQADKFFNHVSQWGKLQAAAGQRFVHNAAADLPDKHGQQLAGEGDATEHFLL